MNTTHFIWLIGARPFDSKLINSVEIYCELMIVIMNFAMQIFLTDYEIKESVSFMIIIFLISAICAYWILIIRNLKHKCCAGGSKIGNVKSRMHETDVNINAKVDQQRETNSHAIHS